MEYPCANSHSLEITERTGNFIPIAQIHHLIGMLQVTQSCGIKNSMIVASSIVRQEIARLFKTQGNTSPTLLTTPIRKPGRSLLVLLAALTVPAALLTTTSVAAQDGAADAESAEADGSIIDVTVQEDQSDEEQSADAADADCEPDDAAETDEAVDGDDVSEETDSAESAPAGEPGPDGVPVSDCEVSPDADEPSAAGVASVAGELPATDEGAGVPEIPDLPDETQTGDTAAPSNDSNVDQASLGYPEAVNKPGYKLVFSDEFNGTELDGNRWSTQLRWDGEHNGERYEYRLINGEHQFYVNPLSDDPNHQALLGEYNPFELDGERLAIRAKRNPLKTSNADKKFGPLEEMVSQQEFLSGAMASYDSFSQKYGYFEARIKIPSVTGTFPAFWLLHQRRAAENTQRTEIDIMENLGHYPEYIYNSFHYYKNVSETNYGDGNFLKPEPSGQVYTGQDFSLDYHVYAVRWEPGRIVWYIDDQVVSELNTVEANHEDLYVILNLAVGGNWTNFPETAGGLGRSKSEYFPNPSDLEAWNNPALEIDYVRVYSAQ